ncbi:MAG: c-type cytochrome [Pyrinomonadaceae bacterium]
MNKICSRPECHIVLLGIGIFTAFSFLISQPTFKPVAAEGRHTVSDGASIYAANCASCHGADGRAKTAKGKRSGATDLTSEWNADEARAIRIITNGKGEMPSFKSKLTREEIGAVFGHVRKFRR